MRNGVVHFEIPADDMDRANKFYSTVFDWELSDYPMPDGSRYTGARTSEIDETTHLPKEPGMISGAIMPRSDMAKAPIIAVQVSSVDEYIKKAEANGGKVVMPKTEIGGMGYYSYISDSEGNTIGLWESIAKV